MIAWLLPTIASAIGCLWGWRVAFRHIVFEFGSPDWEDICFGAFMATLACCLWPVFLLGLLLKRTVGQGDPSSFAQAVGGRSRAEKREDREAELRQRERHVEDMERELKLGQWKDKVSA